MRKIAATMHVDSSTVRRNGKSYTRTLLRETYRDAGKIKHRTIANISHCRPEEIEAIRLALRHKGELAGMMATPAPVPGLPSASTADEVSVALKQGVSVGAVWLLSQVARELGITSALGNDRQGKLALWQVIARILDQGSRLSAVRLANKHDCGSVLGLTSFDEDDLYANLDWISEKQEVIEKRLFGQRAASSADVFLYDVTSSYLEGTQNAFAAFGYNRDRKRGKRQIVIGLLCDGDGRPLSIEVFAGNTQDTKTFSSQVSKAASRFGAERVTFVGDRGMIKGPQIDVNQAVQVHTHHLGDASGIVAVGLVGLGLQHRLGMPGLDTNYRHSRLRQGAVQPLRQRPSLQANPPTLDAGCGQHSNDRARVRRYLGLADDASLRIDDADAGLVQGDIQSGIMFHVGSSCSMSMPARRAPLQQSK